MMEIGRYIVRGLLGRGGMGKVYRVELPPIGKISALKLLDPDELLVTLMGYERIRSLFVKEAITLAGLRHPNIIAIHDFDEYRGKPFYIMDYFPNNLGAMLGESYRIENPSRTIGPDKALDYLGQTLDGLGCLHDAGILHRDIKPFNLLISDRDTVKICDFGLSKLRGETFGGPANLNVGSPCYAAPEQESDPDSVDARADLYPLGIMLYRMLTGHLPDIEEEISPYRPPSSWNPDLDPAWDAFAAAAMARDRNRRFSSARAMMDALDDLRVHWRHQKDRSCSLASTAVEKKKPDAGPESKTPRRIPVKWEPRTAARRLDLDRLWRPRNHSDNRLERHAGTTVADRGTGLLWQQSGSPYPRTWHQAHEYISYLNAVKFGGRRHWRLPTAEELLTLLRPNPQGLELCIAPVFESTQRWIWSADRRSFQAAYYVDIELGFINWQDFSAPYYVRGVCNHSP